MAISGKQVAHLLVAGDPPVTHILKAAVNRFPVP
jgi:hypothetical protein